MENVILAVILLLIVGGIVCYLIKARRRGEKCIGCPYARQCGGRCGSPHGEHAAENNTEDGQK